MLTKVEVHDRVQEMRAELEWIKHGLPDDMDIEWLELQIELADHCLAIVQKHMEKES